MKLDTRYIDKTFWAIFIILIFAATVALASATSTLVYSTGNAATLSMQEYAQAQLPANEYAEVDPDGWNGYLTQPGERNNFRMPDYHRADISVNLHRTFARRNMRRHLNFSVYNLYNRANPYITYVSSQYSYQGYPNALVQLSIFPILPSVAYTLYF